MQSMIMKARNGFLILSVSDLESLTDNIITNYKRMRKIIAFLIVVASIFAGCHNAPAPLETVNSILGDKSYFQKFGMNPGKDANESVRIRTHLEYAEELLRTHIPAGLTPALLEKRMELLDLLHGYIVTGVFPANHDYPGERKPCFIDRNNRICAVGYLVEKTAGRSVAEEINSRHQYEKILEMNDPLVDNWISGSGLTKQECAMIQPSYGWLPTPAPTDYNHISTSYGVGSAVLGGVNLSLMAINTIQISGKSTNAALPAIGLMTGAFQIFLGIDKMPSETKNGSGAWTTNESKKTLSFINIGLGTTTMVLSLWNLCDNKKYVPKPISWNVYGFPAENNQPGLGFYFAHRF
jgi:hypothetical protein